MFVQHRRDTSMQSIIEAVDHSGEIRRILARAIQS
jgi:hypothetical protein